MGIAPEAQVQSNGDEIDGLHVPTTRQEEKAIGYPTRSAIRRFVTEYQRIRHEKCKHDKRASNG